MSLNNKILGEAILGDGDRSPGGPPEPPVTSTAVSVSIIDTGVKIASGNTTTVIDFIAVDSDGALLTDLTGFSVVRKKGSGAAVAMTSPTVTQINKTLMPGWYSLLCDEDTTISAGIDSENIVFRIRQATMQTNNLRAEIFRPKLTEGFTLAVDNAGRIAAMPDAPDGWIKSGTIAVGVFPANFNQMKIQLSTGKLRLTNDSWLDGLSVFGFNAQGSHHLSIQNIKSRLPTALSLGGNIKSDQREIAGSADTNSRFSQAVQGNVLCTVGDGSTTTSIVTALCNPPGVVGNPDQFKGQWGKFPLDTTTPELRGQTFEITGSTDEANPVLTVAGLTVAPINTDKFVIS